jgi:hypothetical protein
VNGITAPSTTPPTSHQNVAPVSHAAMEEISPTAPDHADLDLAVAG